MVKVGLLKTVLQIKHNKHACVQLWSGVITESAVASMKQRLLRRICEPVSTKAAGKVCSLQGDLTVSSTGKY